MLTMDRDFLAAAAAAGADVPCDVAMTLAADKCHGQYKPGTGHSRSFSTVAFDPYTNGTYEDPGIFDLPNVDDLEVAAAAAAAALEVLAPAPSSESSSSSDDDSDDESSDDDSSSEEDSDSDDSSSSDDEAVTGTAPVKSGKLDASACSPPASADGPLAVRFELEPASDASASGEGEKLHLRLTFSDATASVIGSAKCIDASNHLAMREVETDSDPLSSSSSEDEDDAAAAAVAAANRMVADEELQALDHQGLKELITRAYDDDDMKEDDDEEGGGGGGRGRSALQDLGLPPTAPDLSGVELTAEDVMEPAGTCLSVCEGILVVQGLANSKPLAEGSVVVADDRTALGLIEEVFGPVVQPLYAFRHMTNGPLPDCVKPGAALFVVPRLTRLLSPDEIFGSGARVVEPEPASDDEVYFSDDEAEQHFLRQQVTKRKGAPEGGGAEGPSAMVASGDGGGGGGRPRQRSRAAAISRGPSTQFQVNATAGVMHALLGLGGDERHGGGGGRGGRHGGGGGRAGGRGAGWGGGQILQQHQGGRGPAGGGGGGSGAGGGKWMRPVRDDDNAAPPYGPAHPSPPHPHPHSHPQPYVPPHQQPAYYSGGGPPPVTPYHQHSPSFNGPPASLPRSSEVSYHHQTQSTSYGPPQPMGNGAGYGQLPQPSYKVPGQTLYHYSNLPGSGAPHYQQAQSGTRPPSGPGYYPQQQQANGPPQPHHHHPQPQQPYGGGESAVSPGYRQTPHAPPQYGNGPPQPHHHQPQPQQPYRGSESAVSPGYRQTLHAPPQYDNGPPQPHHHQLQSHHTGGGSGVPAGYQQSSDALHQYGNGQPQQQPSGQPWW